MLTKDDLEQIGKVVEEKIKVVEEKIKASEERVTKKIDTLTEDMAGFFHKTWEKMGETDERVTTIEDHLELPHPTEN